MACLETIGARWFMGAWTLSLWLPLILCSACDNASPKGDTSCAADEARWYVDADGDGFGEAGSALWACEAPPGRVAQGGDCDDADAGAWPGAPEDACVDTEDRDCDGALEAPDQDNDGADACTDCDDADPLVRPELRDACDGLDQDCDGEVDEDAVWSTWYWDEDGDGRGVPTPTTEACALPAGYAATPDDCDDADPGRAPGLAEVCDDGVDQDCSGLDITCGLTGDAALVDSAARILGDDVAWCLGGTVRYAGDATGDGRVDVVTGAVEANLEVEQGGSAFLLSSSLDGARLVGDIAAASLSGTTSYINLGQSVSGAGDGDGDGYADVAVGAFMADGATPGSGAVYVLYGPWTEARLDVDADAILAGETPNAGYTGYELANAGDVSGDGVDDLIIGAHFAANLGTSPDGEAYVVFGPAQDVALRHADALIQPSEPNGQLGAQLAGLGDTDGDGVDDVVVGWPAASLYGPDHGVAVVLSGPISGTLVLPDAGAPIYDETRSTEGLGWQLASGADLDGDGYTDALVGQGDTADGPQNGGAVYLVPGPITGAVDLKDVDQRLLGRVYQGLAARVETGGDLDGDGHLDVAVGAATSDKGLIGTVYVVYGPVPSGTSSLDDADVVLTGEHEGDVAGFSLALDGDLNEDGYADLLIGAPHLDDAQVAQGAVYALYGGPR